MIKKTLLLLITLCSFIVYSQDSKKPNIIMMIGDGMGISQISSSMYSSNNYTPLERSEFIGLSKTHSLDNLVTDSAASGTALSSGVKTYNGVLGLDENYNPVKSILLSVKDMAYNPDVKAIIVFSNSGKSAKLVSAMRPAAKIVTISPNINVSRQVSLLWGVQSINSRDANGWKDMMSISKEIIKKLRFIKKNDFVVITAGLPFGKAGMTNMVRLYKVGS